MKPTRRLFLHNAAVTAVAAGFLPAAFASERLAGREKAFSQKDLAAPGGISMRTFEPWIGSSFQVALDRKPMGKLVLLSVEDMSPGSTDSASGAAPGGRSAPGLRTPLVPQTTSFALHFKGSGAPLPQDTYQVSHDWLGEFSLFLVPSGLSRRPSTCTAVFTLIPAKLSPLKPN